MADKGIGPSCLGLLSARVPRPRRRRAPAAPVDIAINAVIVSGAHSPWGAVQRGPGVRTITVTAGIIALGATPLPGEPPPGSARPGWLRVIRDPRLLNGSVIRRLCPTSSISAGSVARSKWLRTLVNKSIIPSQEVSYDK